MKIGMVGVVAWEKRLGVESVILEGRKNGGTSALIADLKQYYSRTNLLVH